MAVAKKAAKKKTPLEDLYEAIKAARKAGIDVKAFITSVEDGVSKSETVG